MALNQAGGYAVETANSDEAFLKLFDIKETTNVAWFPSPCGTDGDDVANSVCEHIGLITDFVEAGGVVVLDLASCPFTPGSQSTDGNEPHPQTKLPCIPGPGTEAPVAWKNIANYGSGPAEVPDGHAADKIVTTPNALNAINGSYLSHGYFTVRILGTRAAPCSMHTQLRGVR